MFGLATPKNRRLAYGFWRYRREDLAAARVALEAARAAGIDHLDTADVYGGGEFGGAELLLGELRRQAPDLFDGASVATKVGVERGSPYNSSSDYIARACDASLQRLGVERIDLFYIHRLTFSRTPPNSLARSMRWSRRARSARLGYRISQRIKSTRSHGT